MIASFSLRLFSAGILFATVFSAVAAPLPEVRLDRHSPGNLFPLEEPVEVAGRLIGFAGSRAEISATLKDYWGAEVERKDLRVDVAPQGTTNFKLPMGKLNYGYYELEIRAAGQAADGKAIQVQGKSSLGVAQFFHRTAREVREGGYVFGLKWWGGVPNPREDEEALVKLGLQWTRIIQNQGAPLTTKQMLSEFPMNAVIKVERFPAELYDVQRYGPLEEWEKKYGRGAWTLKTLPKKEPYQEWLRKDLAENVPADQNVFEIWNEAWDKMPPEDFATLCQWIVEVITKDRPDAIIGPNLLGNTSPYEYDARVIKAGGMKGMKMVALHPYGQSEDRAWLRHYRQWLKEQLGWEPDIYITEFGSHSAPEGPARRSEQEQARRVVRQALSLYAEGAKALTPHWLGQTEKNPSYHEDWFGFLRRNEEPKPVLLAYANAARLVDGSRYVGDLWYGPRVEAMLFERGGIHTVVLWTLGEEGQSDSNPPAREIELQPGTEDVTLVDISGRESKPAPTGGKLKLVLSEAPVFLVGVSPELAKQASRELRPDRWPQPEKPPRNTRVTRRLVSPPAFDGKFESWKGSTELAILNPKVNGDDASATGYLGWDEAYLYVGVNVRDNEMLNKNPRAKLYQKDSVELFISTEPRDSGSGFGPGDHQFFLSPDSGEGGPIFGEVTNREAGQVEDVKDAKFLGGKTPQGWAIAAAIPWSALPGFKPAAGARLALEMRVNDADTSHERFKLDATDASGFQVMDPASWSLLELQP